MAVKYISVSFILKCSLARAVHMIVIRSRHFCTLYSNRDEAQGKMMALKEKADKDLTQYNTELKELMRIIEHDRKLKEFMRIKSEERAEMMEYELSTQRKKKDEKERGDKAEETIEVRVHFIG